MPSSSAATQPAAFRGRHVFVAGGSSGINFGIAQAFARAGAVISVISRSAEKVAHAAQSLQALGTQAIGMAVDVRLPAAVEAALAQAVERFGPIDVLVSGAAGNFLLARPCA
jgi:NAD(P)-dependent dehydrogenase (short-subunit alcohol dehydrogenase family)